MVLMAVTVILAILYLLALMGRTGHPGLEKLRNWRYAHRGLHGNGIPENSMAAFRAALEKGYGIELDLHLLKDGSLGVIHDSKLKRTTGAEGYVEDLTAAELTGYHLEGTEQTIPEFRQVLELFDGKAPMIVELKAVRGNHAALCRAACDALSSYPGPYCIESFDPRCVQWLRKNQPDVIRGQLSQNFLKEKNSGLSWPLRLALSSLLTNFLTRPDFVAYRFSDRRGLGPWLCSRLWQIQSVSWTLRRPEELAAAEKAGSLPIFESFEP